MWGAGCRGHSPAAPITTHIHIYMHVHILTTLFGDHGREHSWSQSVEYSREGNKPD